MSDEKDFKNLVAKIEELKKSGNFDLSKEEDLSIAIMNLISLEEHFYFTAEKTGKNDYFDMMNQIREVRKTFLAKMIDRHEGETWCISKHLLASAMRLIEVGTKYYGEGKKDEAKEYFDNAYKIYSLFWGVRLKLIDLNGVKKVSDDELNNKSGEMKKPWSLEDIVNKMVDCCNE